MTSHSKTLVTLATYNEIENLPRLVDEIARLLPAAEILVIDDNSPDGTGQWCDERAKTDTRVHCLHRKGKQGLGSAIVAGMQYAIEHSYRYVLNMDADFSHPPRFLADLIGGMHESPGSEGVDVMIGSRYMPGGAIQGWPWRRHFMSRAVNCYARWMLGLRVRDCSGSFRCYRVDLLKRLDFDAVRSRGYSFQEEILWRLKWIGARMRETPITFVERQRGTSKINSQEAREAMRVIFALGLQDKLERARRLVGLNPT